MCTPYQNTSTPYGHFFLHLYVYTYTNTYVIYKWVSSTNASYFLLHDTDNLRHVKTSKKFTILLKAQLFFSTASILVPFLLPPFNKSMHSCPVKVILLPLQPLENAILQCLFIWIMGSSQTVFKINKWGESDGARS